MYSHCSVFHGIMFFIPCHHCALSDCTPMKPEMDAVVHLLQFYTSVIATVNCSLCSRFLVIVEEMLILHESRLNAQFYCKVIAHNLRPLGEVKLLYDLRFMQYVCS